MGSVRLPLRTERLLLRPHRRTDAEALHRIYARPDVARFLLDDPWTREKAERSVAARVPRTGLETTSASLALVITQDEQVVGDVVVWLTDRVRKMAEIGWVLDPEQQGRGIAQEAAGAVLEVAFGTYGVHRVQARMDARNTGSAALCERLGMRREAHHLQAWWSKGEWTDTLVYAVLGSEPRRPTRPSRVLP